MSNPRIYIACLAAYNNGHLHGDWIDADKGVEYIQEGIKLILDTSPIKDSEEWAIHDFENFGSLQISEYESIEKVAEYATFAAEFGELGMEVLANFNGDMDYAKEALEDHYWGEHSDQEEFAYYLTHEVNATEIPKNLEYYIDYKMMARDLFCGDFYFIELQGNIHVFTSH